MIHAGVNKFNTNLLEVGVVITMSCGIIFSTLAKQPVLCICSFIAQGILLTLLFIKYRSLNKRTVRELSSISGITTKVTSEHVSSIAGKEKEAMRFINALSEGLETTQFHFLNESEGLGFTLTRLREKITSYKAEDSKRNWVQGGLAKFANLLRFGTSLEELSDQVIKNIVQYVGASQAALFVVEGENENSYLIMKACYAYNRKKYLDKKIYPGQGMIGECMSGKEMIYLKEVPADYVHITSGLGEALPRNILILPLIFNGQVHAVLELASFQYFEEHQITFLQKVAENIAAEIASRSSAMNTQHLLAESKRLADELNAHDEELRQNMEELSATQEQMERKQAELNSVFSAINNTVASIEFDLTGKVLSSNTIFMQVAGYTDVQMEQMSYQNLLPEDERNKTQHHMMWANLRAGQFFSGEFRFLSSNKQELWMSGTFNPICNTELEPFKVIMIAQFTGQEKTKIAELTNTLAAIKYAVPYVELDLNLKCKSANEKFLKLFNLKRLALKDLSFASLLSKEDGSHITQHLTSDHNNPMEGEFGYWIDGKQSHIHTVACPVKDNTGKISKILVILTHATAGNEQSLMSA